MVRVKICGITRVEDALCAVEAGADAIGFIFYDKSKRNIEPQKAFEIVREIPPFVSKVGVFVNEDISRVIEIAKIARLDIVQLHGEEDLEYMEEIQKHVQVLKAFRVKDETVLEEIKKRKLKWFLLDAYDDGEYGGTGKKFNWDVVLKAKEIGKVILAGGINIESLNEALELDTYGLDISSGVEVSQGIKDHEKIKAIFKKIKSKVTTDTHR